MRFDNEKIKNQVKPVSFKDDIFYIQLPTAGFYHILVKGKTKAVLNLQASYVNKFGSIVNLSPSNLDSRG